MTHHVSKYTRTEYRKGKIKYSFKVQFVHVLSYEIIQFHKLLVTKLNLRFVPQPIEIQKKT